MSGGHTQASSSRTTTLFLPRSTLSVSHISKDFFWKYTQHIFKQELQPSQDLGGSHPHLTPNTSRSPAIS